MTTNRFANQKQDVWSLAARVSYFYRFFNGQNWSRCYEYIDPRLRAGKRVGPEDYTRTMRSFFEAYGPIQEMKILKRTIYAGSPAQDDPRDFAYLVISWKDHQNQSHHFRERWIKDRGQWFTRVVGLVPGPPES